MDQLESFGAVDAKRAKAIESRYTPEQQEEIERKRQILSSVAFFIGKDFRIPVELNEPGEGWHWDFKANVIRIDPQDLLEKPFEYLRFIVAHEGGHRRISRTAFIPKEVWEQPGFAFMMNAIEDPRDNNFIVESYPRLKEDMKIAYDEDVDIEKRAEKEGKKKLGTKPRFLLAGFEYIKQWYRESQGLPVEFSSDLPSEVREVVEKTLESARDSWLRYPSRVEADTGEEEIEKYARVSYEINLEEIWPAFKTLIEQDQQDQELQQALQDQDQAGDKNGEPSAVDLDGLSEEFKQKIRDWIDSLPDDQKKDLKERAKQAVKDFEGEVNQELAGKLVVPKESEGSEEAEDEETPVEVPVSDTPMPTTPKPDEDAKHAEDLRQKIKELTQDKNVYEACRHEMLPLINKLEEDLREIFVARRAGKWQKGFARGKKIDIKRRMQEKAKEIPAMESRAWKRRELPQEKDYAITLLVDLSGSMRGEKISETFKAVVVLAEVLNRLSIKTEIVGFNNRLYDYQTFGQPMTDHLREKMSQMPEEVEGSGARWNDDGWALTQASERLKKQKADLQIILALSDGMPEPSPAHAGAKYDLGSVIKGIEKKTKQILIGLGIGQGTGHVSNLYPNSLADIDVNELAAELAGVIRDLIADPTSF